MASGHSVILSLFPGEPVKMVMDTGPDGHTGSKLPFRWVCCRALQGKLKMRIDVKEIYNYEQETNRINDT